MNQLNKNNIVVAIYFHPEAYPPTLNAVGELSKIFDSISLIHRPHLETDWNFAKNITLIPSGNEMTIKQQEESNVFIKAFIFCQFCFKLLQQIVKQKPKVVLVYDPIPLFALKLIRPLISKKTKLWYHNHDIAEINLTRKFSIGWFACKYEHSMFEYLYIFSLPALERKQYFPLEKINGEFFFLPNYPSIQFYSQFRRNVRFNNENRIKLIYQGAVSKGHGLEKINSLLGRLNAELHIVGRINREYEGILELNSYTNNLKFYNHVSYIKLPKITSSCDIGLAINEPTNIIYSTGGTASNKIYEYAACGLPILYYDNEHYNLHLGKYEWAFSTDLSQQSLEFNINKIVTNYEYYSRKAKEDFNRDFNYEKVFEPVKQYLV